jgi:hypothetical protein
MMSKEMLKVIKEMCEEEVLTNYDENGNETKEHYENITDGTDGICEGRLEFAEGILEILKEVNDE